MPAPGAIAPDVYPRPPPAGKARAAPVRATLDLLLPPTSDATAARAALAAAFREVRFHPEERITTLFAPVPRLVFIQEGLARLGGFSACGVERIVHVFRPGDVIGSRFLLDAPESQCEIVALGPVRALAISRRDFLAVVEAHPTVLFAVAANLTARLARMTDQLMSTMTVEVPVRIASLLLDFVPEAEARAHRFVALSFPVTHRLMAAMVGASRPHVSTALGEFRAAGVVRRAPRGLNVRPDLLRAIVLQGEFRHPSPAYPSSPAPSPYPRPRSGGNRAPARSLAAV